MNKKTIQVSPEDFKKLQALASDRKPKCDGTCQKVTAIGKVHTPNQGTVFR